MKLLTEVQTIFNQIEVDVDQYSVDKNVFEIQIKQLMIDNDQLLNQIMSQEWNIVANSVIFLIKTSHVLKNNKDAHEVYIKKTIKYNDTLHGFVERARTQHPSEPLLESACMFTKHVQKLLVYASQTCPNSSKPSGKVKPTTSASRSKPSGNTKNNRITRPPRSNQKNKVEDHPRKVKSSLNKTNSISEPISNALVKHSMRNAKFESICAICNKCLFDANHDMCLVDFVNDVNVRLKYKSKRNKKRKAWKPTGKVFTDVGYKWKPTGIFFTLDGNSCPLTRITTKKIVHLKETTPKSVETPKPEIKVYSRRPKKIKSVGSSKKAKIVESKIANNSEPTHLWGSNATDVPSSSSLVNDRLSISSSGIWTLDGNVIISRVYYVEGLRHNLFSVGQFCDADLEVAFRKNTFFIRNLEGVDLLSGSRDTNLYTISLDDMLKTFPICLLLKASKTKSWLWHRRLSHLNFGTLNKLAKDGLARGIPKLKFQKDHLCLVCTLGKSKKSSHQPKAEDTNQEKLYLLHMDLCGPMRVESINRKKYILVIVDDYSRFTWVKFLRSKDEALDSIIKCIKNIQVRLNVIVRNVRTEELGKLNAKADIGIFVRYAPAKKAFRIYNRRTRKVIETIHVMFDELTTMASKQFGSGLGLQVLTSTTSILVAAAPRVVEIVDSPVSTSIGQDAPSSSISSTQDQEHSPIISQGVEDSPKTPLFHDDPRHEFLYEDLTSQGSLSNVRPSHIPFELIGRWTKDHPIANVIGDLSRSVSTRKQLKTNDMWCYFDAFLTSIEPKNFKQAMTKTSWINAMQE
ncbi:integrase, catalytic region, zinc finger, CCHC-type containing protein [Tanacetum coccineum]|uniref:Integrase, catalytic region, zinc finger, CCHC-type containing protein n=1 Tax=Tanacetum coccineum TaxID=301880 RepID=A0ABQ5I7G2_9ASTR